MTKQNQLHDNANVGTRPNSRKSKLSLTKGRIGLLEYAENIVKDIEAVKFGSLSMLICMAT